MIQFDCGGLNKVKDFKNQNHYIRALNILFRTDPDQKYTNENIVRDFCWLTEEDVVAQFSSDLDERKKLLRSQSLVNHYVNMRQICYQDISLDQEDVLPYTIEQMVEAWRTNIVPELEDYGYRPILFVFHGDVRPYHSLRFYVICIDTNIS